MITGFDTVDVRFPTSLALDGSDAMNPDPDYSAAYLILRTSDPALEGHGFCFTIGRGTDLCVQAIRALAPMLVGAGTEELFADMGGLWRRLVGDSQLRWLGPEKGVVHLATAAVVNAVWDLYARARGKPLWKLLVDLEPEEIVDLVDFRYLTDALTPAEALGLLRERAATRPEREAQLAAEGYPAYTTSAGWLGYDDDKLRRRCREAVDAGFTHLKLKVGRTWRTTCGAWPSPGRRSAPTGGSCWTPTRCGASPRRSPGWASWPASTRGGSRSRPAPTTSSATPPSPRRSPRSGW